MGEDQIRISSETAGLVRLGDVVVPESVTVNRAGDTPDAPTVAARFEVRDGRPECVQLTVTARADGRGIRLRDLELFTLDAVIESAFSRFALRPDEEDTVRVGDQLDDRERWAARRAVVEARTRRRKPSSASELERVAEVYREHITRQPTKAVALVLGYSHRTAARRVQQARDAGLLPPTTPGKKRA